MNNTRQALAVLSAISICAIFTNAVSARGVSHGGGGGSFHGGGGGGFRSANFNGGGGSGGYRAPGFSGGGNHMAYGGGSGFRRQEDSQRGSMEGRARQGYGGEMNHQGYAGEAFERAGFGREGFGGGMNNFGQASMRNESGEGSNQSHLVWHIKSNDSPESSPRANSSSGGNKTSEKFRPSPHSGWWSKNSNMADGSTGSSASKVTGSTTTTASNGESSGKVTTAGSGTGSNSGASGATASKSSGNRWNNGLSGINNMSPGSISWSEAHPRRTEVLGRDKGLTNEINQDKGQLGGNYGRLMQQDQAIHQQEQADAKFNGGYITPQERSQLNGEEKQVQREINGDHNSGPFSQNPPGLPQLGYGNSGSGNQGFGSGYSGSGFGNGGAGGGFGNQGSAGGGSGAQGGAGGGSGSAQGSSSGGFPMLSQGGGQGGEQGSGGMGIGDGGYADPNAGSTGEQYPPFAQGSPEQENTGYGYGEGNGMASNWMPRENGYPRQDEVLSRDENYDNQILGDRGQLGGHYNQLMQEDNAIRQQEQAEQRFNGGYLTLQQQRQLNHEENFLHHQLAYDHGRRSYGKIGQNNSGAKGGQGRPVSGHSGKSSSGSKPSAGTTKPSAGSAAGARSAGGKPGASSGKGSTASASASKSASATSTTASKKK